MLLALPHDAKFELAARLVHTELATPFSGDAQARKMPRLAQKLGQRQPFLAVFSAGMRGPTCIVWADLTPVSLEC